MGVKFGAVGWLVLIDNRWTRIDGPRDSIRARATILIDSVGRRRQKG
jgi:hypothetical protein